MDCGQPIGDPRNRVGFAGACRMLDQIVFAGTVLLYICQHLPHNIVLMVAGEDHFFFDDDFGHAILHHFFLFLDVGDKAVEEVRQLEKSYRTVMLFYKNTDSDKIKNISIVKNWLVLL